MSGALQWWRGDTPPIIGGGGARMRTLTFVLLLLMAVGLATTATATDPLTGPTRAALARALTTAWLPLESGLALSATTGTPISAKYEIDDGAFQLSVYT